ncbi:hypothetical protein L1049_018972 [Liquidambar formosana]|uniref:Aminotransferase-like plant mobile domain-containing protein n=1 Tax=Liquidambar formosana TaxID=63359 RepID=A0AAP0RAX2_LIQFO
MATSYKVNPSKHVYKNLDDVVLTEVITESQSIGPYFSFPNFPTPLNPYFPLFLKESSLLNHQSLNWAKWMSSTSIQSWPRVTTSWTEWVERLEPKFNNHWKKVGIYEHIMLTKHDYPMDRPLLATALNFWSISSNCFFFPYGPMTPTVFDLCALTGLPATGDIPNAAYDPDVDFLFSFSTPSGNSYRFWLYEYFPEVTKSLPTDNPLNCYGGCWIGASTEILPFTSYFSAFFNLSIDRPLELFFPFGRQEFGLEWFIAPFKENEKDNQDVWTSYLTVRDLHFAGNFDKKNLKVVVEIYSPNLVCHQFGFTQMIPVPSCIFTLNSDPAERLIIAKESTLFQIDEEYSKVILVSRIKSLPKSLSAISPFKH